jgi:hypothetical protein
MKHFADEGFFGVKLPVHHGPCDAPGGLDATEEMISDTRSLTGQHTYLIIEESMASDNEYIVRAAERLVAYDVK